MNIQFGNSTSIDLEVSLWTAASGWGGIGRPLDRLVTLSNPSGITGAGTKKFTFPGDGFRIKAGALYTVVVTDTTGFSPVLRTTTSDSEDRPPIPANAYTHPDMAWFIGDRMLQRSSEDASWSTAGAVLGIEVHGHDRAYSTNNKLSDIGVVDDNGNRFEFEDTFDPEKGFLVREFNKPTRRQREQHTQVIRVPDTTGAVTLTPTPEVADVPTIYFIEGTGTQNDRIVGSWEDDTYGNASEGPPRQRLELKYGLNTFIVRVLAEARDNNSASYRYYYLNIFREADTDCQTGDMWCADMTVGSAGSGRLGYVEGDGGQLSRTTFTFRGTDYTVDRAYTESGNLRFRVTPRDRSETDFDRPGYILMIDGEQFPLDGGYSGSARRFERSDAGLSWSSGQEVQLRLVRPIRPGPKLRSANVNRAGDRVILRFDNALDDDADYAPTAEDFTVTVNRRAVTISGAATNPEDEQNSPKKTVHLELGGTAIRPDDRVTVSYENTGGMLTAIQDTDGNEAEAFADAPVENDSEAYASGCQGSDVWCAEMRVGTGRANYSNNEIFGYQAGEHGSLDDRNFDYDGTDYRVKAVAVLSGSLYAWFDPGGKTAFGNRKFTLVVDGKPFSFADPEYIPGLGQFRWDSAGLSWSNGDRVNVRLVKAASPPELLSAKVDAEGRRVLLQFNKAIDASRYFESEDFTVKANGAVVELDDDLSGADDGPAFVTITVDEVIEPHDRVTVSYKNIDPFGQTIRDLEGSEAVPFTDVEVENNSIAYRSGCNTRDDVWCRSMTVGSSGSEIGFGKGDFGSLSPVEFVYDGRGYTIDGVFLNTGVLALIMIPTGETVFDSPDFTLLVDGTPFSMDGAFQTSRLLYTWSNSGLSWSDDDTVTVRLVSGGGKGTGGAPSAPPSSDPLTASLDDRPGEHDGETPFTVQVAFSEPIATSFRDLDEGFSVTGGEITGVRRVEKQSDLWELDVEPSGNAGVVFTLEGGRACSVTGAPCTSDGRTLSETLTFTVPGPDDNETIRPLDARIDHAPAEHDGESSFEVRLEFSQDITASQKKFPQAFDVTNGRIERTRRVGGRSDLWRVVVEPDGVEAVTVLLEANRPCGSGGVPCAKTANGEGRIPLSYPVSVTVPGPEALSVADAEATEGVDETMDFTVSLDRPAVGTVTVDYATRDGTATAPGDYTETEGTLTFTDGEDTKTVSVPIVDDGHDDDGETFAFVLSNAQGARVADGEAVGTIRNSDAMPRAWIARFGRTVAEQVIDAVESRMRAPRTPGAEVSLAGQRIGLGPVFGGGAEAGERREDAAREARRQEAEAAPETARLADWLRHETDRERRRTAAMRTATGAELMLGSSFALTAAAEGRAGGTVSLWGRAAVSRFDGREGRMTLDGEVVSGLLGADWSRGRATAGLIVGHSRGEGGYRSESGTGGTVSSTLTGFYPWGRYSVSERVSVWGLAGYGEGTLTLTPEGSDGKSLAAIRTDLDLTMAAAGLRGVLVEAPEAGGMELAVKTDAMGVRTSTAKVRGLSAAKAEVTRLRLGLEGSRRFRFEGGSTLTPSVEIGVRQDGGDAETGFGADIGGGLAWSDPKRGLTAELRGRGLLAHEAKGFRERGLSGSLGFDPTPQSDRGLTLSMRQTVGAASSGGMEGLLSRGTLEGLAANDNGGGDGNDLAQRRFEMKLGYGFSAFSDRFTMTPEVGLGFSNSGRDYSLGWRLVRGSRYGGALELALEARRRESANPGSGSGTDTPGAAEHSIGFKLTSRF